MAHLCFAVGNFIDCVSGPLADDAFNDPRLPSLELEFRSLGIDMRYITPEGVALGLMQTPYQTLRAEKDGIRFFIDTNVDVDDISPIAPALEQWGLTLADFEPSSVTVNAKMPYVYATTTYYKGFEGYTEALELV